jgi:hypothetical protein
MRSNLKILTDTPTQVIILNPHAQMDWFYALTYLMLAGVFIFLAWKTAQQYSRLWAIVPLVICVIILSIITYSTFIFSHKMIINQPNHMITHQILRFNHVVDEDHVDLRSVVRADMEFNRTSRRIVLTLDSGQRYYPLGWGFEYKDNQFQVLGLIQERIAKITYPVNK